MIARFVTLALLASVLALPVAAAAPCTWSQVYVAGVDVDVCASDESGRPTIVMVKHKDVGGVAVSDTESSFWGAKWRFTDVIVWTYWRTPVVGQSATYAGFWCIDYEEDGNCDWFAVGSYHVGMAGGAGAYLRYTSDEGWATCTGSVVNCSPFHLPEHDFPYLPYLP